MFNLDYVLRRKFTRKAPNGVSCNPFDIYEDFGGEGGSIVCRVSALGNLTEPYANLLAAAPDMLAALKFIAAPQPYGATQEWRDNVKKGRAMVLAAIAKAEGRA